LQPGQAFDNIAAVLYKDYKEAGMKKIMKFFLFTVIIRVSFGPAAYSEVVDISINDNFFQPEEQTVTVGDTVRWTHNGFLQHTTTSGLNPDNVDGIWDSGTLFFAGQSFSFTFNETGTFPYHCRFHWFVGMTGTIIVQPALIPLPAGQQSWSYGPVTSPGSDPDPSNAEPVGVGPVAEGGYMLTINILLGQFAGLVDIYGAYSASTVPSRIFVLNPDGESFQMSTVAEVVNAVVTGKLPPGIKAWKTGIPGGIEETLLNIPVLNIPQGEYTIYLLVSTAGALGNYYLWTTFFIVP
jgi:plastocyanin